MAETIAVNPKNNRHSEDFLRSLRVERNCSTHTLRAYGKDLERFFAFLGPDVTCNEADHRLIRGFLSEEMDTGLGNISLARRLATIRSFYRWLAREGLVKSNPAKLLSSPKRPKLLPRVPTVQEMDRALNVTMKSEGAFPERDTLILELLYGSGLRNSELTGLNLDDIHHHEGTLLVRGKGKKERRVPISVCAMEALQKYLPLRQAR